MKNLKFIISFLLLANTLFIAAQEVPKDFQNPILPGFNPDPSICRVGDDYYLATSSFVWYPGIPIYHSKDLVNWELIGHGISRPEQLNFDKIKDEKGIWAVSIRYHEGLFYLITTCSECGGNFYITARDPRGPWSDPIWLKDAPGIDPSLFWDDDGKCYYTGNRWDFQSEWPSQCAIWTQELDLKQQTLVGERKILSYGHANNASHTEAPHIYKIDGKYLLITAEGGSGPNHAVTAHHSSSVFGPYISDRINPVLTHRHLGKDYPIQTVGHADLVQTPNGEWWSIVLGTRVIDGKFALTRETFLCKVSFENGTPIFNPGIGKVLEEQQRPNLLWTPVKSEPFKEEFNSDTLSVNWHTVRVPKEKFYQLENGSLTMPLKPQFVDETNNSSILIRRIQNHQFSATTKLTFSAKRENEQAGLILHRTSESYYMLLKEKSRIVLVKKYAGKKEEIASLEYSKPEVYLCVSSNSTGLQFYVGETPDNMIKIGGIQDIIVLAEGNGNRFNGPGVGMYATSNGQSSKSTASFDWFEYKNLNKTN